LARADGQEFFALMVGLDNAKACAFVESVRLVLSNATTQTDDGGIAITFSAGVSNVQGPNLDQLIQQAYQCLHRAKEAGGDLVFGDDI
jgi:PleD family two-component response regulator